MNIETINLRDRISALTLAELIGGSVCVIVNLFYICFSLLIVYFTLSLERTYLEITYFEINVKHCLTLKKVRF